MTHPVAIFVGIVTGLAAFLIYNFSSSQSHRYRERSPSPQPEPEPYNYNGKRKFKSETKNAECTICQNSTELVTFVTLFCGHQFHSKCIHDLRTASQPPHTCPNCRALLGIQEERD